MSLCSICDGEGYVHRPNCLFNSSLNEDDCNCDYPKCSDCKGSGLIEHRKNKKVVNTGKEHAMKHNPNRTKREIE